MISRADNEPIKSTNLWKVNKQTIWSVPHLIKERDVVFGLDDDFAQSGCANIVPGVRGVLEDACGQD